MKKAPWLVAALTACVLAAGTASAEMYVEGYLGYNFAITAPNPLGLDINPQFKGPVTASLEFPRSLSPNLMGGGKLGIWFSRDGFPRVEFPSWMKYLGTYLDVSLNGLNYLEGIGSRRMYITPSNPPGYQHYKFSDRTGNIVTIAFMFAARYGFQPTEKVPFGKWQPYVAAGPAIFLTTLRPMIKMQPSPSSNLFFPLVVPERVREIDGIDFYSSTQTTVSLGLAAEIGLRYMITKFLSVETSAKYRYTSFSTTYDLDMFGYTHQLRFSPQLNLFSIHAGVAYHF